MVVQVPEPQVPAQVPLLKALVLVVAAELVLGMLVAGAQLVVGQVMKQAAVEVAMLVAELDLPLVDLVEVVVVWWLGLKLVDLWVMEKLLGWLPARLQLQLVEEPWMAVV